MVEVSKELRRRDTKIREMEVKLKNEEAKTNEVEKNNKQGL